MDDIIIDDCRALPKSRRWMSRTLTGLFWGFFLYLLHPLFELVPAFLGGEGEGKDGPSPAWFLLSYLLFLAGIALLFQAWILYERSLGKMEMEKRTLPAGEDPPGPREGEAEALEELRIGKVLQLRHHPDGRLAGVKRLDPCA